MIVCFGALILWMMLLILDKKKKIPFALDEKEKQYFFIIILGSIIIAMILFAAEYIQAQSGNEVTRNSYGGGSRLETFEVTLDGELEKEPFTVEIGEQVYTPKETQEMFEEVMEKLDEAVLGKNKSKDRIERDLNLVTTIDSYPVEISWELDRYDVLNIEGEILENYDEEEGTLVEVRGTITYAEEEAVYVTHVMVFPEVKTGKEKWLAEIENLIQKKDEATKEEESFSLPDSVQGKKLTWSKPKDSTGYYILVLGVVAAGLIPFKKMQDEREQKKKKREQMLRDYPDIISKFTLLLGTGMTLKRAWMKIVQTYEGQKSKNGVRAAYEEMRITYHEMQGGFSEKEAYERFGQRCELVPYMKLGVLLSQNLKKGSKGLTELLKMESMQAFENRKAIARKRGEEASTKLLLPMFGMLAVVMIMVIVPAFLSIQL